MAITSVHCRVLGTNVTTVIDLEGSVIRVICPEYEESTGGCRVKKEAQRGGPLSRLLERVAENTLSVQGTMCALR